MTDYASILRWCLFLLFVRVTVAPFLSQILGRRTEGFYVPTFLFLWTYLIWILGSLWRNSISTWTILFLFAFTYAVFYFFKRLTSSTSQFSEHRETEYAADAVFWFCFLVGLLLRSFFPQINFGEKYADLQIFQSLLHFSGFPPKDLWLSGESLNYYYFGQLLFAPMTRLLDIPPEWSFNLSVVTVLAFSGSCSFTLVRKLGGSILASITASFFLTFAGNWAFLRIWTRPFPTQGFYWWDSSRAIQNTITEFPFFSFLLGDFHAHFIALPFLSLHVGILLSLRKALDQKGFRSSLFLGTLSAISLGMHYPLNAWELPVLAFLTVYILGPNLRMTLWIAILSYLLFLPFWFNYEKPLPAGGLVWLSKSYRSHPFEFVLHWAPFFALLIFIFMERARPISSMRIPRRHTLILLTLLVGIIITGGWTLGILFILSIIGAKTWTDFPSPHVRGLICVAFFLMAFCEVFSLDQTYGEEFLRLNTVFKFYFLAWWLLSVSVSMVFFHRLQSIKRGIRITRFAMMSIVLVLSSVYPVWSIGSRAIAEKPALTLDGMFHWPEEFPGEREGIEWIRKNTENEDVLLEAYGPGYRKYARFSSFAGRPTIVGWLNHQQVWRKDGYPRAYERIKDLEEAQTQPNKEKTLSFLEKYQVRYIVLGSLEQTTYPLEWTQILRSFPVVFSNTYLSIHEVPKER